MHHYNGIWGTCAPPGRNMHHQGAICTMVHKGDHIFLKIQGTLMIFCFGGSLKTHTKFVPLLSLVSIFPVTLCTTTMVYGGLVHHGAQGRLYFLKNSYVA